MTATIFDALVSLGEDLPFLPILLVLIFIIFWSHAFVVVYHLVRFGIGIRPKIVAFVFFLGSAVIFSVAVLFYTQVEMPAAGQIFNNSSRLLNDIKFDSSLNPD